MNTTTFEKEGRKKFSAFSKRIIETNGMPVANGYFRHEAMDAAEEEEDSPTDSYGEDSLLRLYLRDSKEFSLLTSQQVVDLSKTVMTTRKGTKKNLHARNQLILGNLRYVISLAKKYCSLGVSFEDLIAEGNLGLIIAAQRFDYRFKAQFTTYAKWWILYKIRRAVNDQPRQIRMPINQYNQQKKVSKFIENFTGKTGEPPTNKVIAEAFGMSVASVRRALYAASIKTFSLDAPLSSDESEVASVDDQFEDESAESPAESANMKFLGKPIHALFAQAGLDRREQIILEHLFGFVDNRIWNLREVGKIFKLSRERIRQIEVKALKKLRRNNVRDELLGALNGV